MSYTKPGTYIKIHVDVRADNVFHIKKGTTLKASTKTTRIKLFGFDELPIEKKRMTDIYNSYNGRIYSSGKFCGEMLYAPYFFNLYTQGFYDKKKDKTFWFQIIPEDREIFPEISEETEYIVFQIDRKNNTMKEIHH